MDTDFHKKSYDLHKNLYNNSAHGKIAQLWTDKESVDYWRHERMYQSLDPLLRSYKHANWLTIGDGRYGTDANYILTKGIENVLATDISDTYLKIAKETGFIKDYKVENAEQLSFEDESFDFVLCKESYHHFPRPAIALYEMLRVAKKGIVLIEPNDNNIPNPRFHTKNFFTLLKRGLKDAVKKMIGRKFYYDYGRYETVGNYVFTISEREIEKVALGLNYDMVAFKGLNDFYLEGSELEKKSVESQIFSEIKKEISLADIRVKKGEAINGMLVAVIFKMMPEEECIKELDKAQFIIKHLPKNPYIH